MNSVLFLGLDLEGEAFRLVDFLTYGPDVVGLPSSEMGSTETGAGCVGSNTTEISR